MAWQVKDLMLSVMALELLHLGTAKKKKSSRFFCNLNG